MNSKKLKAIIKEAERKRCIHMIGESNRENEIARVVLRGLPYTEK